MYHNCVLCGVYSCVLGGGRAKLSGRAAALPTAGWPRRCCQVQLRPVQTSQPRLHRPAPAGAAGDRRGLGAGGGGQESGGSWCCPDAALTQIGPGRSSCSSSSCSGQPGQPGSPGSSSLRSPGRSSLPLLLLVTTNLDGKYSTIKYNPPPSQKPHLRPGSLAQFSLNKFVKLNWLA